MQLIQDYHPGKSYPDGSTHYVFLSVRDEKGPSGLLVLAPVDIERMPRLNVTHQGTPMEVRGAIADVGPVIVLMDATLTFLD